MTAPLNEPELLIDTSKMNTDQARALELAEASRSIKSSDERSLCADIFMGNFDFKSIMPFPEQSAEDKKIGDEIVAKLSDYLSKNLNPDEVDRDRSIPKNVIDDFFKMGIFAMKVPKEYGGLGLTQLNYNRVMSMIASYCGSTAVMVSAHQSIGVPQPLKMFGTKEQKAKYFPRFRQHSISGFALTEPEVGSDPARLVTTATPIEDGKYYVINGEKLWCTNGPVADLLVVMAKTPPKIVKGKEKIQITAFIVEKEMPGVEVLHHCRFMGLNAMENGIIKFNNVKVPAENIIYEVGHGLKMALATLNIGRLTLPAASTGGAKQCVSIIRRFGNKRKQWGQSVGLHEFGSSKIAYITATTFAMEAMTHIVSHFADNPKKDIRIEAAVSKLFCTESAWKIIDTTMQFLGGRGYENAISLKERGEIPYPVERFMRDSRINTIIEGTSEIQRLFIAREAMDRHFQIAGKLIKKGVPINQKIGALIKMTFFYGFWYPTKWFKSFFGGFYGGPLGGHLSFISKTSNKLALTIFHKMGQYQTALEKKQLILGNMVDIGAELFAMAGAVSYARKLKTKSAYDLADYYCRMARRKIADNFRKISSNDDKKMNAVARDVLDKKMSWLENEIVWIGPKD